MHHKPCNEREPKMPNKKIAHLILMFIVPYTLIALLSF